MISLDTTIDSEWVELDKPIEPKNKYDLEKIGYIAIKTFSFLAAFACISTCCRKRKGAITYSPNLAQVTIAVDQPEAPENLPVPSTTPEKRQIIQNVFETVATGTLIDPRIIARLKTWETEIDDVHPFEFLKTAPKNYVTRIFQEASWFKSLKINGVVGGVKKGMERAKARNNLNMYVENFAISMNKCPHRIKQYIQNENWQSFVEYLFLP